MLKRIGNLKPDHQAPLRNDVMANKLDQYGKLLMQIRNKQMGDVIQVTAIQFKADLCKAGRVLEHMMLIGYSKAQLQLAKLSMLESL